MMIHTRFGLRATIVDGNQERCDQRRGKAFVRRQSRVWRQRQAIPTGA